MLKQVRGHLIYIVLLDYELEIWEDVGVDG